MCTRCSCSALIDFSPPSQVKYSQPLMHPSLTNVLWFPRNRNISGQSAWLGTDSVMAVILSVDAENTEHQSLTSPHFHFMIASKRYRVQHILQAFLSLNSPSAQYGAHSNLHPVHLPHPLTSHPGDLRPLRHSHHLTSTATSRSSPSTLLTTTTNPCTGASKPELRVEIQPHLTTAGPLPQCLSKRKSILSAHEHVLLLPAPTAHYHYRSTDASQRSLRRANSRTPPVHNTDLHPHRSIEPRNGRE